MDLDLINEVGSTALVVSPTLNSLRSEPQATKRSAPPTAPGTQ